MSIFETAKRLIDAYEQAASRPGAAAREIRIPLRQVSSHVDDMMQGSRSDEDLEADADDFHSRRSQEIIANSAAAMQDLLATVFEQAKDTNKSQPPVAFVKVMRSADNQEIIFTTEGAENPILPFRGAKFFLDSVQKLALEDWHEVNGVQERSYLNDKDRAQAEAALTILAKAYGLSGALPRALTKLSHQHKMRLTPDFFDRLVNRELAGLEPASQRGVG